MKKKIIILGSATLLLIIVGVIILLSTKKTTNISTCFDAVMPNPALIIEINDFNNLMKTIKTDNKIYEEIILLSNLNSSNSLLHYIDSIKTKMGVFESLKSANLVFTLHREGSENIQTCIIPVGSDIKEADVNKAFAESGKINEREFKNTVIHEFVPDKSAKLFFCVKNGLLIISFNAISIEKSIEQLDKALPILSTDTDLAMVQSTAGKNEPANFYVNLKVFPDVIKSIFKDKTFERINKLKHFSSWTELDLNFSAEKISLNGFIATNDSLVSFTDVLFTQKPIELNILEIVPDNTAFYAAMAMSNTSVWNEKLNEYLNVIGEKTNREKGLSEIKKQFGIDLTQVFYPMVKDQVCISLNPGFGADYKDAFFTIISLKSKSSALLELEKLIKTHPVLSEKGMRIEKIKIDEKTDIDYFYLPFAKTPELLFGPLFKDCIGEYVFFIDNFMIFANSKESAYKFAYDAVLNKTLNTNLEHRLFVDNFSDQSLLFVYTSFSNGINYIKSIVSESASNTINDNSEAFQRLGHFGYQIKSANNMLYNNIVIHHSEKIEEKPHTIWESRIDNPAGIKPTLVINHDDNTREILIQDEKNILYLLSNSGREIWRLQLDERIQSKVYQIDLYKNGKLQYLFSTESKLHLIDRLGNYIEKYPVKLRTKSSGPMSLFDYENNKNYRIIIPCEDKNIYLYDEKGNLVKGWEFDAAENPVSTEISHYVSGSDDYIVFNDKYKAYFISRTGNSKLEFITNFSFSKNNKIWHDYTNSAIRFVGTDDKGTLRMFYTDGRMDSLKLKDFTDNHYFALSDIDSDGREDYVFADGKNLEVYNNNKKLIMSYQFNSDISFEPVFYKFPRNQTKVGIVCMSEKRIYLINHDGSLFNGFPLTGLTQFSIGYLSNAANKFNLIVGGTDNLLYNYEVNEN